MRSPFGAIPVRYSVIIPAYFEASLLPRLLVSVDAARRRRGIDDVDVVVADDASTADTAALARHHRRPGDALPMVKIVRADTGTRRHGARSVTDVRDARSTFSTRKLDEHGDWHWIWLQARLCRQPA